MNKKKLLAILLSGAMAMTLAACGGDTTGDTTTDTDASGDGAATAGSYTVGICQQMQHAALDQATQGFQDKLTELVTAAGGSVEFELDNASGESANAATIVNGFVSSGVDLIMANGTTSLQAAQSGTVDIPILGTSITDYATALQREDWSGTSGTNISGTTDLAPLEDQAQMILDLFPEAENVGLLYCSAEPNSVYQVDIVRAYLEGQGITCTDYTFADSNDLASVAQSACTTSDAIYIPTDNTAASYASTIHKSQGSEYKSVIINLQCAHAVMLVRPLVYTAITRAKERVLIVGERRALCIAIKRTDTEQRGTMLSARIKELISNVKGDHYNGNLAQ